MISPARKFSKTTRDAEWVLDKLGASHSETDRLRQAFSHLDHAPTFIMEFLDIYGTNPDVQVPALPKTVKCIHRSDLMQYPYMSSFLEFLNAHKSNEHYLQNHYQNHTVESEFFDFLDSNPELKKQFAEDPPKVVNASFIKSAGKHSRTMDLVDLLLGSFAASQYVPSEQDRLNHLHGSSPRWKDHSSYMAFASLMATGSGRLLRPEESGESLNTALGRHVIATTFTSRHLPEYSTQPDAVLTASSTVGDMRRAWEENGAKDFPVFVLRRVASVMPLENDAFMEALNASDYPELTDWLLYDLLGVRDYRPTQDSKHALTCGELAACLPKLAQLSDPDRVVLITTLSSIGLASLPSVIDSLL